MASTLLILSSLHKIETMVKNKEFVCEMLDKKLRVLERFQSSQENDRETAEKEEPYQKQQISKQIYKLHREVKHYDDIHSSLHEQVIRKNDNLKKHTDVVEKLYIKYKDLCMKAKLEPKILLEKNEDGIIEVTLVRRD